MALAAAFLPATDAAALWDDRLELFASEAVSHDDNVFRISERRDPQAAIGSPTRGDTYRTTSFGFNLDVPVSRQRFQAGLSLNRVRYERFTVLDLNARQARALWQWRAGERLDGRLGYTETVALASLANVQSGVQSATPNILTTRRAFAGADARLAPRWQLSAEASEVRQSNGAAERQVNDLRIDGAEATLSYVSRAANRIGLNLRFAEGSMPNAEIVNAMAFDNSYRQKSAGVVGEWTLSGHSRVRARAGRVSRSYRQLPERDFEGSQLDAAYVWTPTGKLTITALAQKDISSTEQINVAFVYAKRIALLPALAMTDKFTLAGALERSDREYRGDPALVLGTLAPISERVTALAGSALYRPTRNALLQLDLRRERRTSTADFADYQANVLSLSARLGF